MWFALAARNMQKPVAEHLYFTSWTEVDPSGHNDNNRSAAAGFCLFLTGSAVRWSLAVRNMQKPVVPLRFVSDGKSGHRVPRIPEW